MKLSVIRYKNYGCTFSGPDEESDWENKFYWSFYELNNGKTICLHLTENWLEGKLVKPDLSYSYTRQELNNGEIFNYEFGDAKAENKEKMSSEFFEWFEAKPSINDTKTPSEPVTLKEENCIKEFYDRFINKDEKTDTVEVKDYFNLEDSHQS